MSHLSKRSQAETTGRGAVVVGDAVWAAVALLAIAWELLSSRLYGDGALGGIMSRIAGLRGGRALLFVGWLWLGWHFLIRYNPRFPG